MNELKDVLLFLTEDQILGGVVILIVVSICAAAVLRSVFGSLSSGRGGEGASTLVTVLSVAAFVLALVAVLK